MKSLSRAPRFVKREGSSPIPPSPKKPEKPGIGEVQQARLSAKDSYGAKNLSKSYSATPRANLTDASSQGAAHGFRDAAVSAVLLGATGIGAFAGAAPAMAEPLANHVSLAEATPVEITTAANDSIGIEMADMPEVRLNEADPVDAKVDAVMKRFGENFEAKSRMTPSEIANPHTVETYADAPGYKKISDSEMKKLLVETLKEMPLGSLPAGETLVELVENMPGFEGIDVSTKSFNEIQSIVSSNARNWFEGEFGEFIDNHKVEVSVATLGVVSGARASSSSARDFINKHAPEIRVWNESNDDGNMNGKVAFRYRGDDILPNLHVSANAGTEVGPVNLRAGVVSNFSLDNIDHLDSRLDVGARIGDHEKWADASAWVDHDSRYGASFEVGTKKEINGYYLNGNTRLDLGPGTAVDAKEDGRFSLNVTAAKTFYDSDNNPRGSLGVYGSHAMDVDGGHKDTSVGVMFRWSF